jgi:hypothetical protein
LVKGIQALTPCPYNACFPGYTFVILSKYSINASLPSATAVLCCECKLLNDKQELFLKVDCKDSKSGKYGSEIKIDFAKKLTKEEPSRVRRRLSE